MDQVKCVVCGRMRARTDAEVLTLTAAEKEQIEKLGEIALAEVAYCRPCYRLMTDPKTAIDLMAGTLALRLRAAGVQNPEQTVAKFKAMLLAKSKRRS